MDPSLRKEIEKIRAMVRLRYQTPTREWPLIEMKEFDSLFVVREWPSGEVTAYTMSRSEREDG